MAQRPHHLPASYIGGFGQPDRRDPKNLRAARVCVRRKDPDKLLLNVKAEEVGFEYGIYDVQDPTLDLPADFAEREWEKYEGKLPGAVRALDSGVFGPAEWQIILLHVQAVWARHPDFTRDVADQSAGRGEPRPVGDDVQRLRRQVLPEVRAVLAGSRFALLRRHRAACRFVVDLCRPRDYAEMGGRPLGGGLMREGFWHVGRLLCSAESQALKEGEHLVGGAVTRSACSSPCRAHSRF